MILLVKGRILLLFILLRYCRVELIWLFMIRLVNIFVLLGGFVLCLLVNWCCIICFLSNSWLIFFFFYKCRWLVRYFWWFFVLDFLCGFWSFIVRRIKVVLIDICWDFILLFSYFVNKGFISFIIWDEKSIFLLLWNFVISFFNGWWIDGNSFFSGGFVLNKGRRRVNSFIVW